MAVKVIRANSADGVSTEWIDYISSSEEGYIKFSQPIKNMIEVKYDAYGNPDISSVDLGSQYDHRVTWLRINVDNLLWNDILNPEAGIEDKESFFNKYIFKLHFIAGEKKLVFVIDPLYDFEIPTSVTQNNVFYSVVLTIEENLEDDNEGNVAAENDPSEENKGQEFFIANSFTARISSTLNSTIFDQIDAALKNNYTSAVATDTTQLKSLIKPKIYGTLVDNGTLTFSTTNFGNQYDRYIRYICFNPEALTSHLKDFNLRLIFWQGEKIMIIPFENTTQDGDDTSCPMIAWIPPIKDAGSWKVMIVGWIGDISGESEYGDNSYYRYFSKIVTVQIQRSKVGEPDWSKYKNPIGEDFWTTESEDGEIGLFVTRDNYIFKVKDEEEEE